MTPRVRVAITGMGAVTPIGVGLAAFADGLRAGTSGGRLIDRFDARTFTHRAAAQVPDAPLAAALASFTDADRDWLSTDRKALFAAAAVAEAVATAGGPTAWAHIPPFARGLSFGPGIDYLDFDRSLGPLPDPQGAWPLHDSYWQARDAAGRAMRMPFDGPMRWAAARYGFAGPAIGNIGACAAGAMAIGEGARLVARGRATVVLAAGFDAMISPLGVMGFGLLGALTTRDADPQKASRPFDMTRDGFLPGEGAGAVVLEAYDHARARGAEIYGEICGYGASTDAYRPTAPPPDGRGAALAIRRALEGAGWAPERVGYVNAHGTGTPLNDAAETAAIKAALGDHAFKIPVSSTKSQLGHLVAGAGAVELVGALLAMNAGFVPPTINWQHPDPACDLDCVPNASRAHAYEAFLSNSFGFGGQNACLAVWKGDR